MVKNSFGGDLNLVIEKKLPKCQIKIYIKCTICMADIVRLHDICTF